MVFSFLKSCLCFSYWFLNILLNSFIPKASIKWVFKWLKGLGPQHIIYCYYFNNFNNVFKLFPVWIFQFWCMERFIPINKMDCHWQIRQHNFDFLNVFMLSSWLLFMKYFQSMQLSCRLRLSNGVYPKFVLVCFTTFLCHENEGMNLFLGSGRKGEGLVVLGGNQCWKIFAGPTLQINLESFWASHLLHRLNNEFLISRVLACEHKDTWNKAKVF